MKNRTRILAFLCNWAPWSCYIGMGDKGIPIPDEVNVIKVMCAGRVNTALLLKAFEKGADGVLIIGCRIDNCQNGTGSELAEKNIYNAYEIFDLLGLQKQRLQFKYYLAHESEKLSRDLDGFVKQIEELGKSPVFSDPEDSTSVVKK
ncbi:MAG: hydrogenase iron-sulfur subunit [Thermodesulfobacteriota bacterium]|nr:hydrogenase iron-sulfur subunit [Thermodesulfobacteriota bacterium]